jgi:translation initiation factor 2B subunit (eIF-2B alpha/beta/delta family)
MYEKKLCLLAFLCIVFIGCKTNAVPSRAGIELQRELDAAKLELSIAREHARQLEGDNERALELVQRSEQRLADFENAVARLDSSGRDIFDRIEERNRLIEELIAQLWRDNQELREQLRHSNGSD